MKKRISRREFVNTTTSFGTLMFLPYVGLSGRKNALPDILIIGDSISMGYTPFLIEMLEEKFNIWHPEENCEGTTKGVLRVNEWIGAVNWDIIHFNFGLHDIKHVNVETGANSNLPEDPPQADLRQFTQNLEIIVERLKESAAKLIFATTTPVPEKSSPYRDPDDVVSYNKAALRIMKKNKIEVNDLFRFVLPMMAEIQLPNNVHFKPEGYKAMAERVAEYIGKSL